MIRLEIAGKTYSTAPWCDNRHVNEYLRDNLRNQSTDIHTACSLQLAMIKDALANNFKIVKPIARRQLINIGTDLMNTAEQSGGKKAPHREAIASLINQYYPSDPLTDDELR